MKRRKIIITCTLLLYVFACNKNVDPKVKPSESDRQLIEQVTALADLHDDGLDYQYSQLSKSLLTGSSRTDQQPWEPTPVPTPFPGGITWVYTNEFMMHSINVDLNTLFNTDVDTTLNHYDSKYLLWNQDQYWLTDYIKYVFNFTFSTACRTALDSFEMRVDRLASQSDIDTLAIAQMGNAMINSMSGFSSDLEKVIFVGAVRTGINSAGYWKREYSKWQELNDAVLQNKSGSRIIFDTKGVLKSDIAGAAVGAVRGAIAGATGGTVTVPGVGTVTGAAAGGLAGMLMGGVGGSAMTAITEIVIRWGSEADVWWRRELKPVDAQNLTEDSQGRPYLPLPPALARAKHPLIP